MFFKIVFFLIFSFMELFAFTISYKCVDVNDSYEMWMNIDHDTLHFQISKNKIASFQYKETNTTFSNIKGLVGYHFNHDNTDYLVVQKSDDPIDIKVLDFKDDNLRYTYQCKEKNILKDSDNIPITWSLLPFSKKEILSILEKNSKKIKIIEDVNNEK